VEVEESVDYWVVPLITHMAAECLGSGIPRSRSRNGPNEGKLPAASSDVL
jgi:hypothetical protein